jgi:replicative DNA helicase
MIPDLDERILGYLFADKSLTLKVINTVPKEYLKPDYQPLMELAKQCVKQYNETPTKRMLENEEEWDDSLTELFQSSIDFKDSEGFNKADFALDYEELKIRFNKQSILTMGKEIFKINWDGTDFKDLGEANKTIKQTIGVIDTIYANRVFKEGSLSETADEARERYQQIKDNPSLARGIHVGLREFDRITNGLQPSELLLIGGESSAGKSALAMNMAINAWKGSNHFPDSDEFSLDHLATDGVNVMYFTIEMPWDPLRRRVDACIAGVPLYGIRDGTLSYEEEVKFDIALEFQKRYTKEFQIIDIPRGCTINQIEAKYIELLYDFTPELIVVDYISLMKIGQDTSSDWLNIGKLAELLHEFCRTYDIPCITPVQLNRPKQSGASSDIQPPDQHRVGRSIMLPQNCNIMLNINSRPDEDTRSDLEINIAKMRDGEKGAFTLWKRFDIMRVYNDAPEGWRPESYDSSTEDDDHV